jgi:hypothetical protein
MGKSRIAIAAVAVIVFCCIQPPCFSMWGQAPTKTPELYFNSSPTKQLYSIGEDVVTNLEFWSRSEQPLYVSRLQNGAFVTFKVTGPDGLDVPWHDGSVDVTQYSPSDFTVLKQYTQLKVQTMISLKDGKGFAFDEPGQYSLTADFSMNPSDRFAAAAGEAKPPVGIFESKASFCIEACILESLPVRNHAPQSSIDVVRGFYDIITKYQQLGIPDGRERQALRPLLSNRLAQLLDSLRECDANYYKRFGEVLRANAYKPATPLLEEGLFTGSNEAATPRVFRIVSSRAIGKNRVDVELRFTSKQTYSVDLHLPPSYEHYEGDVTVILENNRWVIDDYVAMYGNVELQRLSAGYSECKAGLWVGEKAY